VVSLQLVNHEDPERKRLGRLAEKAKLLDGVMVKN
jgi:hypothetical protein